MKKWILSLAVGSALLSMPHFAAAADEDGPNTGAMHFDGGADYVTSYIFRGEVTHGGAGKDAGVIVQPYLNARLDVIDSDDVDLQVYVGTWASIHEENIPVDTTGGKFLEVDYYAGADLSFGPITLGAIWTYYTAPNGAFGEIQEAGIKLSYNDAQMMENNNIGITLSPYVSAYRETSNKNGEQRTYLELGMSPTFSVAVNDDTAVAIGIPVAIGVSLDDYYFDDDGDDENIGFLSAGIAASIPLPLPEEYGTWSLNGSATYVQMVAESLEAANGGDDNRVVGKVGVGFTY